MVFLLVSSGCYKKIATNLVTFWGGGEVIRCTACRTLVPPTRVQTCKLGGLKQHKCIILQFWRSEVQNGSQWAKNPLRGCRAVLLLETVSFPASGHCLHPLSGGPFLHLQAAMAGQVLLTLTGLSSLTLSLIRTLVIPLGPLR